MSRMADIAIAFRTRAATLVVATTGSATLSATATGYARASGSFVDDGFVSGMELAPTGFTQTTPALITKVTATAITVAGGRTVQASGAGRSLVVGLPTDRVYANNDYEPVVGRQFVELSLIPATSQMTSYPARGGSREATGLFIVRWYGIADTGELALRRCMDALEALFAPHTLLALPNGGDVKVRGDVGPSQSEITNRSASHAVCVLSVPWTHTTANAIAA